MRKPALLITIMPAALLLTSACQFSETLEPGEDNNARTYYEALNLETPENAVQTFAKAFQRNDFLTVYLVLDAETQRLLRIENAQTFSWQHLVGENASQDMTDELDFEAIYRTQFDFWYLFDQMMLYAATDNDLLIDLRGDLDILRSEDTKTPDGEQAVDVIATADGVSGEVIFRMLMDRDSRWRVYKVSAPDEDVASWPSALLN